MYSMIGGIKVKVGNLQFNKVFSCKIKKTTRLLSNTATIELPLSAVLENTKRLTIANEIKRGDKVEVSLGYDQNLLKEFEGYIQSISDTDKLVIECEDSMFLLRKPLQDKVFAKTTLKEVVNYIISGSGLGLNSEIPEINFESFALKNVTAIQALQKIKDNYGLMVYLDNDNKIYVGLSYAYDAGKVIYSLQKNVQDNKLTFKQADDLKYKIKAISLLKNNKKIEVETGDTEGELRTLHFNNITDEKKLKELALQEIEKYKYTGYRGILTAWGLPYCTFGMSATIRDNNYPAREGSYYVEGVVVTFGDGITREIELGVKL